MKKLRSFTSWSIYDISSFIISVPVENHMQHIRHKGPTNNCQTLYGKIIYSTVFKYSTAFSYASAAGISISGISIFSFLVLSGLV